MKLAVVIAVDAAAWFGVQVGAGYLVHHVPEAWLAADRRLWRERAWERGGRFYRDRLAVSRWKHRLPEGGAVFRGGFDKRALGPATEDRLVRHQIEARRAELGHWLAMAPAPLFACWNPPLMWPVMALYAVAVNGPCIVAQRYNRLRLSRVLAARANGSRSSAAPRSRSARATIGSNMP